MVYGIIRWTIISLILIILIHHLFYFFKNTLTIPKTKDLINIPSNQYKEINATLISSDNNIIKVSTNTNTTANVPDSVDMKSELKNFFNELTTNNNSNASPLRGDSQSQTFSSSY